MTYEELPRRKGEAYYHWKQKHWLVQSLRSQICKFRNGKKAGEENGHGQVMLIILDFILITL